MIITWIKTNAQLAAAILFLTFSSLALGYNLFKAHAELTVVNRTLTKTADQLTVVNRDLKACQANMGALEAAADRQSAALAAMKADGEKRLQDATRAAQDARRQADGLRRQVGAIQAYNPPGDRCEAAAAMLRSTLGETP